MALCGETDCGREVWAKGYCAKHYYYAQRHGLLPRPQCKAEGCEAPAFRHGYCNMHNLRYERHGDPSVRKTAANGEVASQWCCVERCDKRAKATYEMQVYCQMHFARIRRHGDPHIAKKLANGTSTPERRKAVARRAMERYNKTPYGKLRHRFNQAKRRILKHGGVTSKHLSKEALLVIWNQPFCGICGQPMSDDEKTLDHVIPISKGGSNTPDNWQLAHLRCNQQKGSKLPTQNYCHVRDCERNAVIRGMCSMHYQRWHRHGDPLITKEPMHTPRPLRHCTVEECDNITLAKDLCRKHYLRVWRANSQRTKD